LLSNSIGFSLLAGAFAFAQAVTASDYGAAFANGDFGAALAGARAAIAAERTSANAHLIAGSVELYENRLAVARADLSAVPVGTEAAARASRMLAEVRRREELARSPDASFRRARDVVPFVRTDPLPTVEVLVNGIRAVFQIDTGAPGLTVDPDFARRLRLPKEPGSHIGIFAGGPRRRISQATIARFVLGDTTLRDQSADLLPVRMMAMPGIPQIDGVIGTGVFERFAGFTLDYAHGRLVIFAPGSEVRADAETRVPLWLVGDHFLVTHGTIAGVEGPVLLDTGLVGGGASPSADLVERAHLAHHEEGMGMVPSGARIPIMRVVVPSVRIGSSVEHNVAGFYSPGPSPLATFPFTVNGAISHEFFRHRALTIDFTTMQVLISRAMPAQPSAAAVKHLYQEKCWRTYSACAIFLRATNGLPRVRTTSSTIFLPRDRPTE
jgi:hypothetical protein